MLFLIKFSSYFLSLLSEAIQALVSSLWTWLGISSLFLRHSRWLNNSYFGYAVRGCVEPPIISPCTLANSIYVVSIIISLQIEFIYSPFITSAMFHFHEGLNCFIWKFLHGGNVRFVKVFNPKFCKGTYFTQLREPALHLIIQTHFFNVFSKKLNDSKSKCS